uniref:GDP-L-fucose synthase n=1 Tax=Hucho hucho TaxID=62062 RepID=A0A4W5PVC4_9TELE
FDRPHFMRVLVTGGSGLLGKAIEQVVKQEGGCLEGEQWTFLSSKEANLVVSEVSAHPCHPPGCQGGRTLSSHEGEPTLSGELHYLTTQFLSITRLYDFPEWIFNCSNQNMIVCVCVDFTDYRGYFAQHGRRYTAVIPTNVYGPYDNFNFENGHVLSALMHKTYAAKKEGTPLQVWGSGTPRRQFIYSLDVARLFLWVLREYDEIDPIILSVGEEEELPIKDAVEMIADALDFKGQIVFDTSKSDGQIKKTASNTKLRRYLPDFTFTPLSEGIKKTCDWFVHNYDIART